VDYSFLLNAFDAAIILGISVPAVFMASKIPKQPLPLRTFSLLLSSFLVVHGLYHLAEALGTFDSLSIFSSISDVIVEPAGWVLLFAFVVYYARRGG
jgi:predicted membrane channel-forming protein YqfA (hemolysin III family)